MIDTSDARLLQEMVHRESRSILQYVEDSFPWTNAAGEPILAQLRQMIVEEQRSTAGLMQFLFRRRIPPPFLGSYPEPFTALNYVSLDYLLPRLVEHQQKGIADLERDRLRLTDPEAAAEVEKILATKRRHLQALKILAAKEPQAVS